jgi:peptidoglycan/LPS O-acetylase OafA/YrhL
VTEQGRSGDGKIVFADQLRSLAALSVVLSHLAGVFILMGPLVGWITSSPEVHVAQRGILHLTRWNWLNFGALGVAVFFLISGFVIPFSLRSLGAGRFLVARAFRIFPTLWAALLLEWLVVFAQSRLYGLGMAFTPTVYLHNATLLDTAIGDGFVDLVNWTLAIEVKFYMLVALLRPWVLRGSATPLIGFSLFAVAVSAAQAHGIIHLTPQLAHEPTCIGFMLIGTVFHYRMTGLMGAARAWATGAVMTALFLVAWRLGPFQDQFPNGTVNYLYGLAIFGIGYAVRGRLRPLRGLDFLAGVSFPLYLIHSIVGYSLLGFMMRALGLSYAAALPAGFLLVLLLAWALHRLVERPSMAAGKKLARSLPGGRRPNQQRQQT